MRESLTAPQELTPATWGPLSKWSKAKNNDPSIPSCQLSRMRDKITKPHLGCTPKKKACPVKSIKSFGPHPTHQTSQRSQAQFNQLGNIPSTFPLYMASDSFPPPLCEQLTTYSLPPPPTKASRDPHTPPHLWPWYGHLETRQAVRLKSRSNGSLRQFLNFPGCGENFCQSSACFSMARWKSAGMLYWPACQVAYKRNSWVVIYIYLLTARGPRVFYNFFTGYTIEMRKRSGTSC
jgi:hypothetical protein